MFNALFLVLLPRIILFFPAYAGYLASHIDAEKDWRLADFMRFFACLGLFVCFCICGVNNGVTADVMVTLFLIGCLPRFVHLAQEMYRDFQSLMQQHAE